MNMGDQSYMCSFIKASEITSVTSSPITEKQYCGYGVARCWNPRLAADTSCFVRAQRRGPRAHQFQHVNCCIILYLIAKVRAT